MNHFERELWRGRWHIAGRCALALLGTALIGLGLLGFAAKVARELRGLVGP